MILRTNDMKRETRERMRGGDGRVDLLHLEDAARMKHTRLLARMTLEPGSGIGEHEHVNETEYYIILAGTAEVVDDGKPVTATAGDVVVTGGGASHSIRNAGDTVLDMIALIILD